MNTSALYLIKDLNMRDLSAKFTHFSENDDSLFIHFNDKSSSDKHIVAKKIKDSHKIQAEFKSPFFELMENIIQNNPDLSTSNLNSIMAKEVGLFKEARFQEKRSKFDDEMSKFSRLEKQYEKLNIFSTPINKWEESIISSLVKLKNNELIPESQIEYKTKFAALESSFRTYLQAHETAMNYTKIMDSFVKNSKSDSKEIKKIQNMFIENLTFEKALTLPEPKASLIFNMLLEKQDFQDEVIYDVRKHKDIDAMLLTLH